MYGIICFICGMMLGGSAAFLMYCIVSVSGDAEKRDKSSDRLSFQQTDGGKDKN